jgi:antibiotic biosynthesis monooxygenase (ABM) superfamily enzyme
VREHLRRWNDSAERAAWIARAAPLSESERTQVTTVPFVTRLFKGWLYPEPR